MRPHFPILYEIAWRTYAVNEFGMASFYVLVGDRRGLVIDCGCGSIDARHLVEELCPLPYDVVLTHAHGDHAGAMSQWDSVWIHPDELPLDLDRMAEQLWENPAIWKGAHERGIPAKNPAGGDWDYPNLDWGAKEYYDFSQVKFMGFKKLPAFRSLAEGQVFDLGGRTVEVLHTPGHTLGGCCFIDRRERILFSGDSCNYNCGAGRVSVNTVLKSFLKLDANRAKFDRNFNGHLAPHSDTAGLSMPASTLDDCLWICRALLAGTVPYHEMPARKLLPNAKMAYVVHGAVRFAFDSNRMIDAGETPAE